MKFNLQEVYCVRGFEQLVQMQTILLTPLPIIFEVYKWLLQRADPSVAQHALETMTESLHVLPLPVEQFETLQEMIVQLPRWKGSLEDGCVMLTALQYQCPIWTYNFRDFGTFRKLTFWTPNDSG